MCVCVCEREREREIYLGGVVDGMNEGGVPLGGALSSVHFQPRSKQHYRSRQQDLLSVLVIHPRPDLLLQLFAVTHALVAPLVSLLRERRQKSCDDQSYSVFETLTATISDRLWFTTALFPLPLCWSFFSLVDMTHTDTQEG